MADEKPSFRQRPHRRKRIWGRSAFLPFSLFVIGLFLYVLHDPDHDAGSSRTILLQENAGLLWYNQPSAFHFQGQHNRTYYAYLFYDPFMPFLSRGRRLLDYFSTKPSVAVAYVDHGSGVSSSEPVVIHEYEKLDDHGSPCMWIVQHGIEKGVLMTAYSHHLSPLYFRRSTYSEDITRWSKETVLDDGKCTYCSMVETNEGHVFLFYTLLVSKGSDTPPTGSRVVMYRVTHNAGRTWSDAKKLVDFGRDTAIYLAPAAVNGARIGLLFGTYALRNNVALNKNLYLITSDNHGVTWKNIRHETIGVPVIEPSLCLIYNSSSETETIPWDLELNTSGDLFFTFVNFDEGFSKTLRWNNPKAWWGWSSATDELELCFVADLASYLYPAGVVIDPKNPYRVVVGEKQAGSDDSRSTLVRYEGRVGDGSESISFQRRGAVSVSSEKSDQIQPAFCVNYVDAMPLLWLEAEMYQGMHHFKTNLVANIQ